MSKMVLTVVLATPPGFFSSSLSRSKISNFATKRLFRQLLSRRKNENVLYRCHFHSSADWFLVNLYCQREETNHKHSRCLHFNLNVYASREIKLHEGVNKLRRRVDNVHEALMDAHFTLLARIFMHKRGTIDRVLFGFGGQRNRAAQFCAVAYGGIYNLANAQVDDFVVIRLNLNADTLSCWNGR